MTPKEPLSECMTQGEMDRLYDALASLIDATPQAARERVLARLVIALAQELGSYAKIKASIDKAK